MGIREKSRVFRAFCAAFSAVVLSGIPQPAQAIPAHLCDRAAQTVSRSSGVPLAILRAITRTETGRTRDGALQPWPWTVNMEGAGKWFDTQAAARSYVERHYNRGARSFDVGCFQINYRWHGEAFASIDEMFDPVTNATYAAQFLTRLYRETGDWTAAAGAYHSRTPKFAERYIKRFEHIRQTLETAPIAPVSMTARAQTPAPRVNQFPLLQNGAAVRNHGSLVPLGAGRPALITLNGGS